MTKTCVYTLLLLVGASLFSQEAGTAIDSGTFQVSRLMCVIGGNGAAGEHRAGYNGVFRMVSPQEKDSVFVPGISGLNLEHYFDARPRSEDPRVFFEPRNAPMQFRKISSTSAELLQPPTTVYGVESRTVFELKEPYYIDVTYRAIPRKSEFTGGFLGIFWASYINGPLDKSIYFLRAGSTREAPQWFQFASQVHGRDSTVLSTGDKTDLAMGNDPTSLYRNISPIRYAEPFYYGRFRDMALIYIFKPNPYLRFAHSPSGGGRSASGDDANPAWDFQMVIPNPEVGREYGLDMRVVYKPWAGRADVLREVRSWLSQQ